MSNYYDMLGVRQFAHPAEIDLAYKTLIQVPSLDMEAKLELGMAYNTLLNPSRRSAYDGSLSAPATAEIYNTRESVHIHRYDYQTPRSQENPLTSFAAWYIVGVAVVILLWPIALLI